MLCCPRCGLWWTDPRPIAEEIGKLYARYHTHTPQRSSTHRLPRLRRTVRDAILASSFGYRENAAGWFKRVLGAVLSRVKPLRSFVGWSVMWLHASPGGRLLDVGCGSGAFMAKMRELGWDTVGVEPDEIAARAGQQHFGLNIRVGTVFDLQLPRGSMNAITMNHVIEHVPDPIDVLKRCHQLLMPGGLLVVVTPNVYSLGRRFFGADWRGLETPRHLFLFSVANLVEVLKRAEFLVLVAKTTAKAARFTWHTSRTLRTLGQLDNGSVSRPSWRLRSEGLAFSGLEEAISLVAPVGEEILAIAVKQ